MQNQTGRKRYHKDNAPSDDIITLIHLVRQNPALYNYKLQPNQRRRADVLNGWEKIATQIGNKYSVEECRRKWKNLRDTYHQYRLRKPKLIEGGLSKWRYAKDLEFLSNVYQPKLKSQRNQSFDPSAPASLLQVEYKLKTDEDDDEQEQAANGISHIALEDDAFILTAYEESVNDDVVTTIDHHTQSHQHNHQQHQHHHHHHDVHDETSMNNIDLKHVVVDDNVDDDVEDEDVDNEEDDAVNECLEIVKHEHCASLDDDGATGAEVDYEEVCLYEEAGNPTSVDCEMDGVHGSGDTSPNSKEFQYIDTNDFCIGSIGRNNTTPSRTTHYASSTNSALSGGGTSAVSVGCSVSSNSNIVSVGSGSKLKNLTLVTSKAETSTNVDQHNISSKLIATSTVDSETITNELATIVETTTASSSSPLFTKPATILQLQTTPAAVSSSTTTATASEQMTREELDLFFDFLKKKVQRFPKAEITRIQVEFLNCVLRREDDPSLKDDNL